MMRATLGSEITSVSGRGSEFVVDVIMFQQLNHMVDVNGEAEILSGNDPRVQTDELPRHRHQRTTTTAPGNRRGGLYPTRIRIRMQSPADRVRACPWSIAVRSRSTSVTVKRNSDG